MLFDYKQAAERIGNIPETAERSACVNNRDLRLYAKAVANRGARGECGLRNSELSPRKNFCLIFIKKGDKTYGKSEVS